MRGTPPRVLAALLVVQILFSTLHVVGKVVLTGISPLAFAGARVAIATPILFVLAWRHDRFIPARRDWPRLALLGGLGIFANQTLFLLGLSRTTATSSAILMASIPVFTASAAAALGIERVAGARLVGVILAAGGAVVLLDPMQLEVAGTAAVGDLLILANCLCYAFFLVLQRPLLHRIPWRTLIAACFLFGSIGTLAVSAPALAATSWSELPRHVLPALLYVGIVPTAFNFALATWAVRRTSPAIVAAFTTIQPLLTSALAAVTLGEALQGHQAGGFLLILIGLALVQRRQVAHASPG